jgi:hypothetical protein
VKFKTCILIPTGAPKSMLFNPDPATQGSLGAPSSAVWLRDKAQPAIQVGSWQAWHYNEGNVGKGEGRDDKEAV